MELDNEKMQRLRREADFLFEKYPEHTLILLHTKHKNTVKLEKQKYFTINSLRFNLYALTFIPVDDLLHCAELVFLS